MRLFVALLKKVSLLVMMKLERDKGVVTNVSKPRVGVRGHCEGHTHWWILERLNGAVKFWFPSRSGTELLSNFTGLLGNQPRSLVTCFSTL